MQRLQPVEDQERAAGLHEVGEVHALPARVARRRLLAFAEMREGGLEEIAGAGLPVPVRALAMEAPGEDRARAAPARCLQRLREAIDERGLSRPGHRVEGEEARPPAVPGLKQLRQLAVAAVEFLRVGVRQPGNVGVHRGQGERACGLALGLLSAQRLQERFKVQDRARDIERGQDVERRGDQRQ